MASRRTPRSGFEADIQTPLGFPAHEIQQIAQQAVASLILTRSCGAILLNEVLLGSTASSLLHSARLPVLLIRVEMILENRGRKCRAACGNLFDKILFPPDFCDNAEHALLYLEHLTREAHSPVALWHVRDQAKIERHLKHRLDEFNQIDASRLDAIRLRLERAGAAQIKAEIPYGNPTQVILDRARSGDFSVIVMGCQGHGFLHEIFLGSVAHQVARLAPVPVLFVPVVR
ncbi:MAG: universal stress protein [Bryobacteraceae bacterium]